MNSAVSAHVNQFQSRIASTLQNYDTFLKQLQTKCPETSVNENMNNSSSPAFVQKLLQEHRKNKSHCLKEALKPPDQKTERFEKENEIQQKTTNRALKDYNNVGQNKEPLRNISNSNNNNARNYMSFSADNSSNPSQDGVKTKETANIYHQLRITDLIQESKMVTPDREENGKLQIVDMIQNAPRDVRQKEIYTTYRNPTDSFMRQDVIKQDPFRIEDSIMTKQDPFTKVLIQKGQHHQLIYTNIPEQSQNIINTSQNNKENNERKEKSSGFERMKVEDRLALHDIARSLKIHNLLSEKQNKEVSEIKEIPKISSNSRILAEKSLRVQHNPDIIKRLLDDHKVAKMRLEKETKKKEKLEKNLYSFNPQISIEAQNIKRTLEDLFDWDRKKREKEEQARNLLRLKESEEFRENLQKSRISPNSMEILYDIGRIQRKEPIEQRLLREGQKINGKKNRNIKENTTKIKPSHRKVSSSRSTVDFHARNPKITENSAVFSEVRKTLKFEEEEEKNENRRMDQKNPFFYLGKQDLQENDTSEFNFRDTKPLLEDKRTYLKETKPYFIQKSHEKRPDPQEKETKPYFIHKPTEITHGIQEKEAKPYFIQKPNEGIPDIQEKYKKSLNLDPKPTETWFKEEKVKKSSNKVIESPAINEIKTPVEQQSLEIFSKYLSKKLGFRETSDSKPKIPENEPSSILKSLKIRDPITLFEKKPYLPKEARGSTRQSAKSLKTAAFQSGNTNNESLSEPRLIEKSEENKLKSLFIDSKSFFQKHHLKSSLDGSSSYANRSQNNQNDSKKNSLFCHFEYEEKKKPKATQESLLTSLRYRENKVFSYHDNRLQIQDKNEGEVKERSESKGFPSFYEKNINWLTEKIQRKSIKSEEKKTEEMKECSFQPNYQEKKKEKPVSVKTIDKSEVSSSKNGVHNSGKVLDKSTHSSKNIVSNTANDSYVEIFKRKRGGNSLTGRRNNC